MQAGYRFDLEGQGSIVGFKGVWARNLAFSCRHLPEDVSEQGLRITLGGCWSRCRGPVSTSMPQLEHSHSLSPPAWACIWGFHPREVADPTPDPHTDVMVSRGPRRPSLLALVAPKQSRWLEMTVPASAAPCPPTLVEVLASRALV